MGPPDLHTIEGIEEVLEEGFGEKGAAVEYGYVRIASVRRYRPRRDVDSSEELPRVSDDLIEVWGVLAVNDDDLKRYLIVDAENTLEPGQRFEIRKQIPHNYGRTHGMAWYRNDAMDKREAWGFAPHLPLRKDGYYLVGEYTA
jgi:hypothetical protein